MMFAMATAPLGQPHQSLRSIALAETPRGPEGTVAATEDCLSLGFFSLVPFSTAPWCEPHSPGMIERRTRA